jgi:hypothetical protein
LGSEVPQQPSYVQLATLVVQQAAVIESLQARVASLEVEVVALRRQVGRDSSNSSQPPSKDDPGATAKAKADKRSDKRSGEQMAADRSPKRGQGGQKGHRGSGLQRVAVPDRTQRLEPPQCGGCGAGLAGAPGRIASSVQVFDVPTFSLLVTEYLMMRRVCGCGHVTTADLPAGVRGGPTCYGPNVTAAATLLASVDVIGIERAADLMSALLGARVSTGFVSSCLVRLDAALTAAGFEDALKDALRNADVVGTDETPAPLTEAATRGPGCHNPHVYTVRTMGAYTRVGDGPSRDLVWYGAAGDRTKASISGFGILDPFRGVPVFSELESDLDCSALRGPGSAAVGGAGIGGSGLRDGGYAELDVGVAGELFVELGEFLAGGAQADPQAVCLAEPALAVGFRDACQEVVADVDQSVALCGVGPK